MDSGRAVIIGTAGLLLASHALAQAPGQPAATQPPLLERGGDPVEPTRALPAQRPIPTVRTPGTKDLPPGEAPAPRGVRLSEGTFLTSIPGRLLRARTGDVLFIPAPDNDPSRTLPVMVVLPGDTLSRIESTKNDAAFQGPVTLGGQVFVYRGREYLLATSYARAEPETKPEPTREPESTPNAEPAPAPAQPKPASDPDPRAEDLIKELESQRSTPRALEPNRAPASPSAPAPDKPAQQHDASAATLPEGTVITLKRGRLIRLPDMQGRIAFALDNDPDSPAPAPMVIQPCRQLERLEQIAAAQGDTQSVRMSGRVLRHNGRNYLLPTLVQTSRGTEVIPMQ